MSLTFSIVTPSLNQGQFIEKTIRSVLSQAGDFFIDYIIIDGGSTDQTLPIIQKYDNLIKNDLWPICCKGISLRWWSENDNGQSHAINKGFNFALGDVMAWLNSDDYYTPGALMAVAEQFSKFPEAGAVVGDGEMRDEVGNLVAFAPAFDVTFQSLCGWIFRYFYQPSCFFSRDAWEKCGLLQEWLEYAMDLDLWMKIVKSYKFVSVNSLFSTSLKHDKAKTTAFGHLTVMEVALVIASHGGAELVRDDYATLVSENMNNLIEKIYQIHNSRSWRITSPLRLVSKLVRRFI